MTALATINRCLKVAFLLSDYYMAECVVVAPPLIYIQSHTYRRPIIILGPYYCRQRHFIGCTIPPPPSMPERFQNILALITLVAN